MTRGANILLIGVSLAAAGCTTSHHLQVRAVGRASSASGGGLLAEARGQLALGDVGLALESFRTLQREQPDSAAAYEGVAECYAAMGRYDLARTNYEFALAYAPNDPRLLLELAGALDQLGDRQEAAQVRVEASRLATAASTHTVVQQAAVTPLDIPRTGSVTVKLSQVPKRVPAVEKKTQATPATTPMSPVRQSAQVLDASITPAPRMDTKAVVAAAEAAETDIPRPLPITVQAKPRAESVKAKLVSALRPMEVEAQTAVTLSETHYRRREVADTLSAADAPHLERSSPGEVLLVTAPQGPRFAQLDSEPPRQRRNAPDRREALALAATPVRWLPLKGAQSGTVQLLNAARSGGLAARTRMALVNHGWRRVAVGDAPAVRQHSLVLYGSARAFLGRRLAAQFRCKSVKVANMRNVVVLLGRDAVRKPAASAHA
jgi:hypothetical protein